MRRTAALPIVALLAASTLGAAARGTRASSTASDTHSNSNTSTSTSAANDDAREPHARAATLAGVEPLTSPAAPGSGEPNLTIGANGRVYLSWLEPADSSGTALRMATLDGATWSAPRTVRVARDFVVNWADFPSLAVMPDGRLVAHWLQRAATRGSAYGVRVSQSRDDGRTWSAPVLLHDDTSNAEHGFVAMWADGSGTSAATGAVWLDGRKFSAGASHDVPGAASSAHAAGANEMMVMARSVDARGSKTREVTLDPRACDCCQTAAAMTSNGPVVAYRDRSDDEVRDIAVVRRVNGKWTAPAPVSRDNWKIAACPVNGPAIAARASRVALAWFTAPNDSARVQLAFSANAGAAWSAPVRVDDGNPAGRVGTQLLADGSALVTWIERTGGDTAAVRARRISASGARGAAMTIASSSAARASGFPRVVVSGTHAVFAWTVPGRPATVRTARLALAEMK